MLAAAQAFPPELYQPLTPYDRAVPDPAPPRVAVVAYEVSERSGEERVLFETIRRTHDRIGWVVVSAGLDPALRRLVEWRRVVAPKRPFRARLASMFAFGGARLLTTRADLVHVSGPLVLNRADVASVQFLRAAFYDAIGARFSSSTHAHVALERFTLGRARMLLAPSRAMQRELELRFPGRPIELVPNGVDLGVFRPDPVDREAARAELGVPERRLVAIFAGNAYGQKGLGVAIDGLARARSAGADVELWAAGFGDAERYGAMASEAGVREQVRLLGPRRDLERLYRAADVLVLPSSYESFGLVVLEAAASGIPAIATRTGVVEELMGDDEAGIIVERDADAVAGALTALAGDRARLRTLGEAARRRAAAYSWDRSVDALLKVYDGQLARKRYPSG
jgi:glycosyltransferase involved in cell wall biosynthesis